MRPEKWTTETNLRPDVILAERVGSCTDLVVTVVQPLWSLCDLRFAVALPCAGRAQSAHPARRGRRWREVGDRGGEGRRWRGRWPGRRGAQRWSAGRDRRRHAREPLGTSAAHSGLRSATGVLCGGEWNSSVYLLTTRSRYEVTKNRRGKQENGPWVFSKEVRLEVCQDRCSHGRAGSSTRGFLMLLLGPCRLPKHHCHPRIPQRISTVMLPGRPQACPRFHCSSDRSGRAGRRDAAGLPLQAGALSSQIVTVSQLPNGFASSPNRSICQP